MKKKKTALKKLHLSKEMIGDLSLQQQNKVAGGATGRQSCVTYRVGTKCCMDPV